MGIRKHSQLLCAAAALLTGASADTGDSVARCSITLTSGGDADAFSVSAEASALATADLLCNGTLVEDTADATASVEAIAFAAATAVALVSVDCYNSGNSRFTVDGLSIAKARAEAYASAYVEATAAASVCDTDNFNCTAVASFIGSAFERIFAEAVAVAEVSLDQDSPDTSIMEFAMNVTNATAEVLAVAIASASASVEEGCDLDIIGLGIAGESGIFCAVEVATEDNSTAEDAVAEAVVEVVAVAGCNDSASNVTEETGEALASAIASVIAEVAAFCDTAGTGSVCVTGAANITAVVEATASAFARVFLNATSTCETMYCESSVEVITEAVTNVVAMAAASLLVQECASGGGMINILEFEADLVANTSLALASIIANATVVGGECTINTDISASTMIVLPDPMMMNDTMMNDTMEGDKPDDMMEGDMDGDKPDDMMEGDMDGDMNMTDPTDPTDPTTGPACPAGSECIRNNRQCAGTGFDVALACCSDDYFCVRRNDEFAQCRLNGEPGLVGWEGSILPCGVASNAVIP